uniref:CC domain-containing protein n=1 Tax=Parastrongyloides trichosuri TaxID=131310 RepID=A0A0N4Z3B9_PARTI
MSKLFLFVVIVGLIFTISGASISNSTTILTTNLTTTINPLNVPVGECVGGMCAEGYECVKDYCFPLNNTVSLGGAVEVLGPCINGDCPKGYICKNDSCYFN